MCALWKRPESVPYPSVWRRFEGKKIVNGATRQYWIQDLTEEYQEECLNIMCYQYATDEPLCKYCNITKDPKAVADLLRTWQEILQHKLALVCLTKDVDGVVKIAGINMTALSSKFVKDPYKVTTNAARKYYEAMGFVIDMRDIYSELNVDYYLIGLGLYVLPEYRGEEIGFHLLDSRRALCKAVGLKGSGTVFTSKFSQRAAAKVGFKVLAETSYEDLEKAVPFLSFPGISSFTPTEKHMCISFD